MFLNIHSHFESQGQDERSVRNVIIEEGLNEAEFLAENDESIWLSAGIHPWYINEDKYDGQLKLLSVLARSETVKLIGECGLDRLRGPSLSLQQHLFEAQIALACSVGKPVIVHCVKCFNELILVKKRLKPAVPLIVHGFNANPRIAEQLSREDFYFSFGAALLRDNSNACKAIGQVDLNRVFLETDDSDTPIERIYERAAILLNISENKLKDIIFANYLGLRGKD